MTANGATVLVAGASEDRVDRVARRLDPPLSIRTTVADSGDSQPSADVVLYTDGSAVDELPPQSLPSDTRRILVHENREGSGVAEIFDSVLTEPLDSEDLQLTVEALARQARYDRRLRECAELAARCGELESNGRGRHEPRDLREQVADAKDELDGIVAQFSSDDFRRAFQTLAAD